MRWACEGGGGGGGKRWRERKGEREVYTDGDTVGPLALGLLGLFLVLDRGQLLS